MAYFIGLICKILAHIPLYILTILGNTLGCLIYYFAPKTRKTITTNVQNSGIAQSYQNTPLLVKRICMQTAKGALDLPIAWVRSPEHIASLFKEIHGWGAVQAALEAKKGLLLITPHLGSYDLAGRYISQQLPFPLTAMYRPPKLAWLEPIMNAGRIRGKGKTAPANAQGVRIVLKALKNKEATIVLPDQVPGAGEGVWLPFFGRPAYTMTLAARLSQVEDVASFVFVGVRLSHGRGFALHIEPLEGTISNDKEHNALLINQHVESFIRRFPEQYLWSYNRYKCPRGVEQPNHIVNENQDP